MRPYSTDLRERVAAAVDEQEGSLREIAQLFRVSVSFVVRLLQRRRQAGTLRAEAARRRSPTALGPDDLRRLAELIHDQPDATLKQLKERGGFTCSLKTLRFAARRQNLTFKKKSLHASEQDRPDVQTKRRPFRRKVMTVDPKRLVFVDESGVTTAMTPTHARARAASGPWTRPPSAWESLTVMSALSLDGVRAPLAFPGATDTTAFQAYVDRVLVPSLHKGDVVVLDNIKPHLAPGVARAIE